MPGTCFELERFALRHADRFLWPGGDVLATYRAFYGDDGVAPGAEVPHTVMPRARARPPREAGDEPSCAFSTSAGSSAARACRT